MKLTPKVLADRNPGTPLSELVSANCSGLGIAHIEDLSIAHNLHKLDLKKNAIKKADALSGIRHNKELTLLNLSENALESLEGVEHLPKLLVLNVSHNQVNRISHHVANCVLLKALILNHNKIARIENLTRLTELNTIVLSHNNLSSLEGIGALTHLTKLSAAHNQIRVFPDLRHLPALKELRLNDNKILSVSDDVRYLPALEILDMGNNLIRGIQDVASLASIAGLVSLNLKGNPFVTKEKGLPAASADGKDAPSTAASTAANDTYREKILTLCSTLRVLDNVRFDEKFLERKAKRQELLKKKVWRDNVEKAKEYAAAAPEREKKRKLDDEEWEARKARKAKKAAETEKAGQDARPAKRKRDGAVKGEDGARPAKNVKTKVATAVAGNESAEQSSSKAPAPKKSSLSKKERPSKPERPARAERLAKTDRPAKPSRTGPKHAKSLEPDVADPFFLAPAKTAEAVKPQLTLSTKSSAKPSQDLITRAKKGEKKTPSTAPQSEPVKPAAKPAATKAPPAPTKTPVVGPPALRSGVLEVVEVKKGTKPAASPSAILGPPTAPVPPATSGTGLLVGAWD
ncbi:hypothetical protein BDZ88DRAFT_90623 [Geranomyces variabilis]|nr:hypothetical protein BDZ88DRAFT_90623 [Geranomyces variabilis]KAJ3137802.1 hypothetical protein HDU90_001753 [Geranomyces variabilis]